MRNKSKQSCYAKYKLNYFIRHMLIYELQKILQIHRKTYMHDELITYLI